MCVCSLEPVVLACLDYDPTFQHEAIHVDYINKRFIRRKKKVLRTIGPFINPDFLLTFLPLCNCFLAGRRNWTGRDGKKRYKTGKDATRR